MAVEFRLTLAGATPQAEVAQRALPGIESTPSGLTIGADAYNQQGFGVVVRTGTAGYVEAIGDAGNWVWEPPTFTVATFRITKDQDRWEPALRNLLEAVARVLATGTEDAALVVNGDDLLLTRLNTSVTKHRRADWWDHYRWPNDIIAA